MILQIGSSFGRGIALQAKPDIRPALGIIQRREERRAAERVAERTARDKERKRLALDIKNINFDYSKFDIIYHDDIKEAMAEYIKTSKEEQAKNIYGSFRNTENSLRARRNLAEVTGTAGLGTKELDEAKKFIGDPKNRGLFDINPELNELYLEAQRTGDSTKFWEAFEATGGKRGAVIPSGSLYTLKRIEPDWFKKVQGFKPSKEGTKIERGTVTITSKSANEEANATRAISIFDFSLTEAEQQEAIRDTRGRDEEGSREKAIQSITNDLNARAEKFFGRAEDEPRAISKGWNVNIGGWSNNKYRISYRQTELPEKKKLLLKTLGIPEKDIINEKIFIQKTSGVGISPIELTVPIKDEEGKTVDVTLTGRPVFIQNEGDGNWMLNFKTPEGKFKENDEIVKTYRTKEKNTFAFPFTNDVKLQIEKNYGFILEEMINEVRGLQGDTTIEYTNQRTGKDKKGNTITIGLKEGKWFNIATGEILK